VAAAGADREVDRRVACASSQVEGAPTEAEAGLRPRLKAWNRLTNFLEEVSHRSSVYIGSVKTKSGITPTILRGSLHRQQLMNRFVCLGWISKPERKKFSFGRA